MALRLGNEKVHVSGTNPKVVLEGTEVNAKQLSIRENAGVIEIYDEENGTVVMTIEQHASRHAPNGADPYLHADTHKHGGGDYPVYYTHIAGTGTEQAVGANNTYGTASDVVPDTGFYSLIPHLIKGIVGGTVGSSENITVQAILALDDNTTVPLPDKTISGTTGEVSWSLDEIAVNYSSGKKIVKVSVVAKSDAASTSATIQGAVYGIQFI